jgi:hypothetical protein
MADQTFVVAQPPKIQQVSQISGEPRGYQQLTVSTVAIGLTVPKNANCALILVETDSIRWRDDGTDPTDSVGMLWFSANIININSAKQLAQFKAIRTANNAADAILNIAYYEKT